MYIGAIIKKFEATGRYLRDFGVFRSNVLRSIRSGIKEMDPSSEDRVDRVCHLNETPCY